MVGYNIPFFPCVTGGRLAGSLIAMNGTGWENIKLACKIERKNARILVVFIDFCVLVRITYTSFLTDAEI